MLYNALQSEMLSGLCWACNDESFLPLVKKSVKKSNKTRLFKMPHSFYLKSMLTRGTSKTLLSVILPTKITCSCWLMKSIILNQQDEKQSVLLKHSGLIIKANYTKHLYIDFSQTHMSLNTGIVSPNRANHSQTRGHHDIDVAGLESV